MVIDFGYSLNLLLLVELFLRNGLVGRFLLFGEDDGGHVNKLLLFILLLEGELPVLLVNLPDSGLSLILLPVLLLLLPVLFLEIAFFPLLMLELLPLDPFLLLLLPALRLLHLLLEYSLHFQLLALPE
jgi:hypothetical protein